MPRALCVKCQKMGNLTLKSTKRKEKIYPYYNVQHYMNGNRNRWCYLGTYEDLPEEYRNLLTSSSVNNAHISTSISSQNNTQNRDQIKKLDNKRSTDSMSFSTLSPTCTADTHLRYR